MEVMALLMAIGAVVGAIVALSSINRLTRRIDELQKDLAHLRRQMAADWEARNAAAKAQAAAPVPAPAPVPSVTPVVPRTSAPPPAVVTMPAPVPGPVPVAVESQTPASIPAPAFIPAPVPMKPTPSLAPPAPVVSVVPAAPVPAPAPIKPPSSPPPSSPSSPTPVPPRAVTPARDFESIVGKRWLTWSGIALVFLAGVFFLKYAYDQDWLGRVITPPVRIAGLAAVSLAMLITGLRLLGRGMPALGHGLAGGAVALAYLAVYAGHSPSLMMVPEPIFSGGVAFVLMAIISAAGITLAVRHDALAMAICATVGGFATPILCSTGDGSREGLFTYLLLLDLSVLGAAWWRRWRALDLLAFVGTAVLYMGWYHLRTPAGSPPWGMLAWLGIFHAVFLVLPFANHWRTRSVVTIERFGLALTNLAFTLAYAAVLLRTDHQLALALCCLLLAAVYAGIGAVTRRRVGEDLRVVHGFLGLGAMLLTLGLLYLLPVEAVATAWAVEAAVLLALGYRFDHRPTRAIAHVVLACAVARLGWKLGLPLVLDQAGVWQEGAFIANGWLLAVLVAPFGAAACALVHRWLGRSAEDHRLQAGCWWVAGGLLLLAGTAEIVRHHLSHPGAWHLLPPVSGIAGWWAFGAAGFLAAAWRWSSPATALLALIAALAAIVFGIGAYVLPWPGGVAVFNPRCLVAVAAVAGLVGWVLTVARGRFNGGEPVVGFQQPMLVTAQLATVLVATLETCAWFARAEAPPRSDPHQTLCAVWAIAAIVSIAIALALRRPLLAAVGVVPLMLALVASAALYLRDGEMMTLFANGRFLVALLAVATVGFLRLALPALGWLTTVMHLLATVLVSAEVVRWSFDHFADDEAWRYAAWSVSLVWSLSAAIGLARWRRGAGPGAIQAGCGLAIAGALTGLIGFSLGWQAAMPFLNQRFLAPALAVAVLVVAWRTLRIRPLPEVAPVVFAWMAAAVFFVACTCEPAVWFRDSIADKALAHRLSTFSVTVVWLALASATLYAGFRKRLRVVRFVALGLFALTAAKLLLVDMHGVQQLYRILAFLLTGVVLLAASYVYHKLERRLTGGSDLPPAPPVKE